MEKNKGGEPLFGLFSRPERGAKGLLAWLWCAGWLSGGGCGFVLVVQVGVGFGVSPFCPAPLVPRCPGGGTCTTFALHFSLLGLGKIPNQLFTWPMVGKCHSRHFHRSLLPPTLRGGGFSRGPSPTGSFGGGLLPRPHSHPLSHCHTTFATDLGPQEFWPIVTKVTIFTLGVPIFHPG